VIYPTNEEIIIGRIDGNKKFIKYGGINKDNILLIISDSMKKYHNGT
jgi:hypothetical protein